MEEFVWNLKWLKKYRDTIENIILIAGNHDYCFLYYHDECKKMCEDAGIIYLKDSSVTIDGFKFYGAPWQPEFNNWAFGLPRGEKLVDKWKLIPDDTDILITHGPPYGKGDVSGRGIAIGCEDLMRRVKEVEPRFHIFGHNHHGYGISMPTPDFKTVFINASSCTEIYAPTNNPLSFSLEDDMTI